MFSFSVTPRAVLISADQDFSLVFLVVVYLRVTLCLRISSRSLAGECFSLTREQIESNRRAFTINLLSEFSVKSSMSMLRGKCDRHGNLQSSLIKVLNQGKAAVFAKILFVDSI